MKLKKFEPSRFLMSDYFPGNLNHLVNNFFSDDVNEVAAGSNFFRPSTDIMESEQAYELHLSLPGMKKDDIKIELKNNELVISGERKSQKETENNKMHLSEIIYGKFTRRFYLPEHVDRDKINARFEDGILKVDVIKSEETKPKMISIK